MEQWPSDRIAQGELMQESRMTMHQRQKINYSLRSGDPLPNFHSKLNKSRTKQPDIIFKPDTSKRRQYSSILESGAYERDKYVPQQCTVDREFAKKHLQDFMAYGKELKHKPKPVKRKTNETLRVNRFDELKKEIQERVEFLEDMKKLGEESQYKILMEQQIAARIREMERLKCAEDMPNCKQHVAAVVLARGGSKGIPMKNLAQVGGRSLLSRSLITLQLINDFDAVWVSTDHELIAAEGERCKYKYLLSN
ncbi:uncharacterized protein CBL_09717 [Carabus blaptoides fortunei]